MKRLWIALALVAGVLAAAPAWSGEMSTSTKTSSEPEESYTYQPPASAAPSPRLIAEEKAAIRAQQRMDRLAALDWYGVSLSRPAQVATPFTAPRAAYWDRPHQLPNAWYEAVQRPFNMHITDDYEAAQRGYPPLNR
jgi:hypothetical protein